MRCYICDLLLKEGDVKLSPVTSKPLPCKQCQKEIDETIFENNRPKLEERSTIDDHDVFQDWLDKGDLY